MTTETLNAGCFTEGGFQRQGTSTGESEAHRLLYGASPVKLVGPAAPRAG